MTRPTIRGIAAGVAIVLAIGLAWLFGERSLNAVAAPAAVALLAAGVQLFFASEPTVERAALTPGFPGESRTVSLTVEGGSVVVDIADRVPDALSADGNERSVAPPTTATYELQYDRRGEYTLGPTTVRVRDIFGLLEREVTIDTEATVVVYPQVYTLGNGGGLSELLSRALTPERDEFEDLREYEPGDPLRDVDWKSTAKRPDDLMVKEFAGREPEGSVTLAVSARESSIDTAAAATASVAVALLDVGIPVDVYAPDGDVSTGTDHVDQAAVLTLLARTGHGRVDDDVWASADVTVTGERDGGAAVTIGTHTTSFRTLRTGQGNPLTEIQSGDDRTMVSAV